MAHQLITHRYYCLLRVYSGGKIVNIYHRRILQSITLAFVILIAFNVSAHEKKPKTFVHGITLKIHGQPYHFAGPPDGRNGASDVPGHTWLRVGKNRYIGKHFNTGPFGEASYWTSDAPDGELLYIMDAIIDTWSEKKSYDYFLRGYVHYHHLVHARTGRMHHKKVAWFKHVAVREFEFNGAGPLAFSGIEAYQVMPGVDYNMAPNWNVPYRPNM